jgi:hypothetical protein
VLGIGPLRQWLLDYVTARVCLQSLMHDRFVPVDVRYSFIHTRFAGSGGNACQRSAQRYAPEIRYPKRT